MKVRPGEAEGQGRRGNDSSTAAATYELRCGVRCKAGSARYALPCAETSRKVKHRCELRRRGSQLIGREPKLSADRQRVRTVLQEGASTVATHFKSPAFGPCARAASK